MKTLAAAEADFRGIDRDVNTVADFWTEDVAGLYGVLRWERRDRRAPDLLGTETLTLDLDAREPGRTYDIPGPGARVSYEMSTPSKRQGARAVDLRGTIRVEAADRVAVDLRARMERLDAPGVAFDEAVRGTFALRR